jgi:glycosyltransferase involved in cell wall biosynthesis
MRILQIVHGFPPYSNAGAEKYAFYLSQELAKKHEVHILYPIGRKPYLQIQSTNDSALYRHEINISKPLQLTHIANYFTFERSYHNQEIAHATINLVETIKPDVVHIQHLLNLSASVIDRLVQLRIPVILTLHDFWFICPVVQLIRHTGEVCQAPQPDVCKQCWTSKQSRAVNRQLHRFAPSFLSAVFERAAKLAVDKANSSEKFADRQAYFKQLLSKIDLIIAPSRFLFEMFVDYGVPEGKIVHSENGYAADIVFTSVLSEKYVNHHNLTFGYLGRITREKGIRILVDAFLRLPEGQATLCIYGGYDVASPFVADILQKTQSRTDIHFMGHVDDLSKAYSAMDILIFPSIWYENCPLVLAERQLTKKPVLASNLGAIPEFVNDGYDGFLFQPGDADDLYSKMLRFVHEPELAASFSANISGSPKAMVQQAEEIEAMYSQLIKARVWNAR